MEGQGNFFGVSETSTIDEAMASFLLGDGAASATGDPSKIEKIDLSLLVFYNHKL